MGISALAVIIFAASIPAAFFIYVAMRAYKYRHATKNELEMQEVKIASQNKRPVDSGAQKR